MSLLDAFGRLLRPAGTPTVAAVICPRCEKPMDERHDEKECSSKGLSRRFFFGLLGASSAALAMRLEGVPIPTAHHMVVARTGDYIRVQQRGVFTIAWQVPREVLGKTDEMGERITRASSLEDFMPKDSEHIYVDSTVPELRILSVVDKETHQPLEFRVVRASDIKKKREQEYAESRRLDNERHQREMRLNEMRHAPQGVETFLRVPVEGDYELRYGRALYTTSFQPACGGDARVCYRPLPGWEMVYSYQQDAMVLERKLPANLRRLSSGKWHKHPTVRQAINRLKTPPRVVTPRLPA